MPTQMIPATPEQIELRAAIAENMRNVIKSAEVIIQIVEDPNADVEEEGAAHTRFDLVKTLTERALGRMPLAFTTHEYESEEI